MSQQPLAQHLYNEGDVIRDLVHTNRFGIVRYVHPLSRDTLQPEWEYTIDWESESFRTSTIVKESDIGLTFSPVK